MNMKKFLIGGIVGGIVYFLLGWLFYGNLLTQYFKDHPGSVSGVDRAMEQFQWWALILGNLLSGFLVAYVFSKSAVASLASGLVVGGILGFLISCSYDLIMFATTNITSKHAMLADVATFTVMSAIVGAVVGAIMGMGNRTTVTA
jgi:integral membrane sensor domain MASE1